MSDPSDLNANWRSHVTAPEYAALLRELDDLGCAFEWREENGETVFLARCGEEVVGESVLERGVLERGVLERGVLERGVLERGVLERGAARPAQSAIYEVLDQAAEKLDVLA